VFPERQTRPDPFPRFQLTWQYHITIGSSLNISTTSSLWNSWHFNDYLCLWNFLSRNPLCHWVNLIIHSGWTEMIRWSRRCNSWGNALHSDSSPERGLGSDFHAYVLLAETMNPLTGQRIFTRLGVAVCQFHKECGSHAYTFSDWSRLRNSRAFISWRVATTSHIL
jgi:hypothetical protein